MPMRTATLMNHARIASSRPPARRSHPRTVAAGTAAAQRSADAPGRGSAATANANSLCRITSAQQNGYRQQHVRHQTRPAPCSPRPYRIAKPLDLSGPGMPPTAQHPVRACRAGDRSTRQPGLDADRINLYRHPAKPAKTSGVPRTHQFLVTLTVHTTKINPETTPPATSASSMTNDHLVVIIPSDGQQLIQGHRDVPLGSDPWRFHHRDSRDGPLHQHRHAATTYTTPRDATTSGMGVATAWEFDLYGGTVLVAAVHGAALPDETLERILATEEALGVTNPDCVCRLEHYADQHVDSLRNWLEEEAEAGRTVLGYGAASRAVALFNRAGLFNLPNRATTQL